MDPERIKTSLSAETWRTPLDSGRFRYIRISYSDDLDAVIAETADHKDPWIGDGERYESFTKARGAWGLPEPKESDR